MGKIGMKKGELPFVSVILVSYNSEKYFPDCLNSLKKQTYKNYNVILVDNNSSDNSIKLAKKLYPKIKIIANNINCGFAKGNNLGIKEALKNINVKYIACLNIDVEVDKDWLKELVKVGDSNENYGSVQSLILLNDDRNKINTSGNIIHFLGFGYCGKYKHDKSEEKEIREINYASGSAVLYSRKALEEIGLFDETLFMYHEDLDLGWRFLIAGYKNVLAPKSLMYHKYSFSKNKNKWYYAERNKIYTLIKNYQFRTLVLIFPLLILIDLVVLAYSIKEDFFFQKIKAYRDALANYKYILKKRRIIQDNRQIEDKNIISRFSSSIDFEGLTSKILTGIVNPFLEYYKFNIKKRI